MPEISRFYGIIIRIFTETGERHHVPHVHAYYQGHVAVFGINPVQLLAGKLSRRQRRFVVAWMELYQDELMDNWNLALNRQPIHKVPPLQKT